MKNKLFKVFMIGITLLATHIAFSQNVTINYQTWNPSSPPCDVFNTATNVPATINGTNGTIQHVTLIGDAKYSTTDQSVQLDNNYVNASDIRGTRYRIAYNFKVGYKYIITVTSAALFNSNSPYLRLDLSNNGSSGGTSCAGAQSVNPNLSGNPPAFQYGGLSFQDVQFLFSTPLSSAFTTLEVTSIPAQSAGSSNSIRIRKIVIAETPPPPTFTLASPISVVCGKTNPVTLTVTNVYNTPGVTGYTWNLGATNKWIYNGNPAPATISTAANTLTLSPICGTTPTSVTATANVGANSYATNTATVTSINETLSITGTNPICSGSYIYSIANLPTCGATVTGWAASPAGIVSVTDNGNNTATITKLADGQVTLTATVTLTNPCNTTTTNLSFPLSSGALQLTGYYRIASDYHNYGIFNPLYTNNSPIWLPANKVFGVDVFVTTSGIQSPSWARASTSYPFSWGTTGTSLSFSGTSGATAYSQRNGIFDFTANTGCGVTTTTFNWPIIVQGGGFSVAASPNPATDNLTVSIVDNTPETKALSENETVTMTLYDLNSTIAVKIWKFKNNQSKFNLNISNIRKGYYILKVQKSKYQQSEQILVK